MPKQENIHIKGKNDDANHEGFGGYVKRKMESQHQLENGLQEYYEERADQFNFNNSGQTIFELRSKGGDDRKRKK